MGLKKRSKVSAQFSMSSLTDIIFLLLIFFMLTSSLVAPNALNLKLPSSSRTSPPSNQRIDDVNISRGGQYYLNNKRTNIEELERNLQRLARANSKPTITISPDKGAPTEFVVAVMDIAMRFEINAVLATEGD
jgi:biopolymer transport protein ExbD